MTAFATLAGCSSAFFMVLTGRTPSLRRSAFSVPYLANTVENAYQDLAQAVHEGHTRRVTIKVSALNLSA